MLDIVDHGAFLYIAFKLKDLFVAEHEPQTRSSATAEIARDA